MDICGDCGRTYEGGNHEVDDEGRFPPGGHYFISDDDAEEE
jgi:hypothetical protein